MTNSEIKSKFKLTTKLMELHGENAFKVRSYQNVAETISQLSAELSQMSFDTIADIDGIGKGMLENIKSLLTTGTFDRLQGLLDITPQGVIEMLEVPGFGAKKIYALWKELGAESLEDLETLCLAGQVADLKGFGAKSQDSLLTAVRFIITCRGKRRYAQAEPIMMQIIDRLNEIPAVLKCSETGALRRRLEIIESMTFLVSTQDFERCREEISGVEGFKETQEKSGPFTWVGTYGEEGLQVKIRFAYPLEFGSVLIQETGSVAHLNLTLSNASSLKELLTDQYENEETFYQSYGLSLIAPELREGKDELIKSQSGGLPSLVEMSDLKGILHNHSTYSDGRNTLREMAIACRDLGYEYLGISDHSQTAVYANGLQEFQVKQQQEEIKALNEELGPFKIFSGIESDILNDGSLDYSEEVLSSFDFIVASIHSGLNMDINKATERLLKAIENPYTTILGHMTGRLILEREGYPVDHKVIIDACAKHQVVIEINASPYRLDMDWRWVGYAIEQGVMLSINPDAHKIDGYADMKYGLMAGRKGGLTKESTLNAMNLSEITQFFEKKKSLIQEV